MSALAGLAGAGEVADVERMLAAIPTRGDTTDLTRLEGCVLGLRFWQGRPGKAQRVYRGPGGDAVAIAGTLAPIPSDPAAELSQRLAAGDLSGIDGAFAAARYEPEKGVLTLLRDPFGVRSLFYVEHKGALWFATELKQLLRAPDLPIEPDLSVIHRYLTFSFVPGAEMPVKGLRALPAGHQLRWERGSGITAIEPWFVLREEISITEQGRAARRVWSLGLRAVERRLLSKPSGEGVGLYLSGGIDSSSVGAWLKEAGASVRAFTLDFGDQSVEREEAKQVASALGFPLQIVPVTGQALMPVLEDLVYALDLPFGDPVTGPHALLARAAREAGLSVVFNGEGGDQLFGGWTSKPMIAAMLYADPEQPTSPEEQYLHSYHRFYGMEDQLYTDAFASAIGPVGQRRALVAPYLGGSSAESFLGRVRLTDLHLKGSQNILPRAERISNSAGLDMRVPLFDRALAEESFRIAPDLKLHGACEKYALKLALQGKLPDSIVWRRKYGMSVPVTDLVSGPLAPFVGEMLSAESVRRRGWFRPELVAALLRGEDRPGETRRRRLGERLWALTMLEAWARRTLDRRGI